MEENTHERSMVYRRGKKHDLTKMKETLAERRY